MADLPLYIIAVQKSAAAREILLIQLLRCIWRPVIPFPGPCSEHQPAHCGRHLPRLQLAQQLHDTVTAVSDNAVIGSCLLQPLPGQKREARPSQNNAGGTVPSPDPIDQRTDLVHEAPGILHAAIIQVTDRQADVIGRIGVKVIHNGLPGVLQLSHVQHACLPAGSDKTGVNIAKTQREYRGPLLRIRRDQQHSAHAHSP